MNAFSGWLGWLPFALLVVCALGIVGGANGEETGDRSIALRTAKWERRDGLLTTYLDREAGRLWLALPPPAQDTDVVGEFLYAESLSTGLGQVATGLDRGEIGKTHIVRFRRIGPKVFIEAVNTGFRAVSSNPAERASVEQSFPSAILWAGPTDTTDADGTMLVDITTFIVRDAHEVTAKLAEHGGYAMDTGRSFPDLNNCLSFPDNLEFQAILTFASATPGKSIEETAAAPQSLTLVQHQSLVKLPDNGYQPRRFDPRCGSYPIAFVNFSAPLDAPLEVQYVERFRLQKVDPKSERSRPVKPIVYYLDPGVPEPVRSALLEGARWWNSAFEALGFIDAFRVEMLPEGINPLDVRYNVIEWIHRTTRGSSYGRTITDPRTGEIIKGHVILDSQRLRQVRLIFEGLAGTEKLGTGAPDDPLVPAMARIRQLAVHEVGHTLGFAHNFAASSLPNWGSVMDYPPPRVDITPDGRLDFSNAYRVGLGEWDFQAAKYAYTDFAPGTDEAVGLKRIIDDAESRGMLFLADQDARGPEAANPQATMWDLGTDPVAQLKHEMQVRRIALEHFGPLRVKSGTPLARLEEMLAPVYFHHRHQLAAAMKVVGGIKQGTPILGGMRPAEVTPIDGASQRRALEAVLECLEPEELDLSESILQALAPRPYGSGRNPEMFPSATGPAFDALGAARSAAEMVVSGLLNPERCARLVDFSRRDPDVPSLDTVLTYLTATVFNSKPEKVARLDEVRRAVKDVTVTQMLRLSSNDAATLAARSRVDDTLRRLKDKLDAEPSTDSIQAAFNRTLSELIARHLARPLPNALEPPTAPAPPPGSPLGSDEDDAL